MIPNVDENVLVQEFSLKNTQPPKPEAPWIKRCDYGIKFTDEIQVIDEGPSVTETEESVNKDLNDKSKNDNEDDDSDSDESDSYEQEKSKNTQNEPLNERYYLRNYIKEQKTKMMKSISEQVMRNEFHFFREMDVKQLEAELEEATDEDDNDDNSSNDQEQEDNNI